LYTTPESDWAPVCDLKHKFAVWQGYALKGPPLPLAAVVESTAGLLLN
jgi:hypothetical protein